MPISVGVNDYLALGGTTAVSAKLEQDVAATTQAAAAATTTVLPPGTEAASVLASGKHATIAAEYSAMMLDAVQQLTRRNTVMQNYSAANFANDVEGAANVASADVGQMVSAVSGGTAR